MKCDPTWKQLLEHYKSNEVIIEHDDFKCEEYEYDDELDDSSHEDETEDSSETADE